MRKVTFSLNYRKPKSEYDQNDDLIVCIRYYYKPNGSLRSKIKKLSTGVRCKIKDWNKNWHKTLDRQPIMKSDPDYVKKNKLLAQKVKNFLKHHDDCDNNIFSDKLDSKEPKGPISDKWSKHKDSINLVNPANKRNIDIIVVGTGLAGGSASATLAELGYNVKTFCYQDSPRRAHSIAAQGGINAAKNYQNDGDSVYRLFYDTVKGGDYRSRESNVYRLSEVSTNIIDQCVAQGVPFGRDYGGLLDNRSFGGVLVSRTFYAKGQTGQQLLLGAYSAMNRQIAKGKIKAYNRHEMVELVKVDGKARGIMQEIWKPEILRDIQLTQLSLRAGDMEMSFTFQQMQWVQM